MFGRLHRLNKLLVPAIIPAFKVEKSDASLKSPTALKMAKELEGVNRNETGMDRLYMMFTIDEFDEPSPEITNVCHVVLMSGLFGAVYGGFIHSRIAFLNFVERNDASSFASHLDAKKQLQDKVTVGFAKGAWRFAWRLATFTGTYTLVSTGISVYRGENGILEHICAGMLTGALYKINLGLRGIVVGSVLGAVLGSISGVSIYGLLKLTGQTMEDVRRNSYKFQKSRTDSFKAAVDQYIENKEPEISLFHDAKVGEKTLDLSPIPSATQ